jgi:hypothetical protein
MFGTDLPSTRAPRPFQPSDLSLLIDTLGEPAAQMVLWSNAATFYRLPLEPAITAPSAPRPAAMCRPGPDCRER